MTTLGFIFSLVLLILKFTVKEELTYKKVLLPFLIGILGDFIVFVIVSLGILTLS